MTSAVPTDWLRQRSTWIFVFIAALYLGTLQLTPLFDLDEGAFSEATREMLASGDYLSTTLNGTPRWDKPIFIYWLQAASVHVFGLHEFALRLPSALAACLWCVAVWQFARPRLGTTQAQLAAWITATSIGVLAIGRAATADAVLNLWLTLTVFEAWRYLESSRLAPLRRMYLWIALGVLTKGPIAILIPVAVSLLYCLSSGQWRQWLRAAFDLPGWLLLLVIAGPWYGYSFAAHGRAFWEGFFLHHNVDRFSSPLEGHGASLFYYLLIVPLLVFPWSGLLFRALGAVRSDWQQPLRRFLWLWCGFVVLFFSFSGTKLPHYALYGCTPLFLLMALHGERLKARGVAAWLPLIMLALVPLLPWLVEVAASHQQGSRARYYVLMMQDARQLASAGFYVLAVALLLAWIVAMAKMKAPLQRLATGAGLAAIVVAVCLSGFAGQLLQAPIRAAGLIARERPEPAVLWQFQMPTFSVYSRRPTPAREPQAGELALLRADRWTDQPGYAVIFQERGVMLVKKLDPAAASGVQQ